MGVMISLCLAVLFYRSLMGMVVTWPAAILVYRKQKKHQQDKSKKLLLLECLDALHAAESSLRAGESLQGAFESATGELEKLWGKTSLLLPVWETMIVRIRLKEPPEKAFSGLAEALGLYELAELAELLMVAGRSGSSQADLIERFGSQMYEKMVVESEIQTGLTEKRMEKNIMLLMPPGILLYLSLSSYEWISVLYEAEGRGFMTVVFVLYALAFVIGERYLNIVV